MKTCILQHTAGMERTGFLDYCSDFLQCSSLGWLMLVGIAVPANPCTEKWACRAGMQTPQDRERPVPLAAPALVMFCLKCAQLQKEAILEQLPVWPNSKDRYELKALFFWSKYPLSSALMPAFMPLGWGRSLFQHLPAWCRDLAAAAWERLWKHVRLIHMRQTPDSGPEHTSASELGQITSRVLNQCVRRE